MGHRNVAMAQPSTPPSSRSLPSVGTLFDRTLTHLDGLLVLTLVPLVTALLNVSNLLATAETRGMSITASFPFGQYDLWSFVNAPSDGGIAVGVPFGTMESLALAAPLLVTYIIISGVLSAGYFGSIASAVTTGSFDFRASVGQFAVRMIALEALIVVGIISIFLPLLVAPLLFIVVLLLMFVVVYFLFPTVYLIVLEDRGIESALRRAHELVSEHHPIGFFLALVGATAACSIPLSVLAYSGTGGAVIATLAAAPLSLGFNVATALMVAHMAGITSVE